MKGYNAGVIETTHIWEASLHSEDPGVRRTLEKQYGSKKSGTIYIVADNHGEASEILCQLFIRNGYKAPEPPQVTQTHLVKQALRMSY